MAHYNLAWDATTYFYTLLFRKRTMQNGIYNEHHIILWHGTKKINLIKKRLQCVVITDTLTTIKKIKIGLI